MVFVAISVVSVGVSVVSVDPPCVPVSMRSIRADLRLLLAVVVPVDAFVFRRTTEFFLAQFRIYTEKKVV